MAEKNNFNSRLASLHQKLKKGSQSIIDTSPINQETSSNVEPMPSCGYSLPGQFTKQPVNVAKYEFQLRPEMKRKTSGGFDAAQHMSNSAMSSKPVVPGLGLSKMERAKAIM